MRNAFERLPRPAWPPRDRARAASRRRSASPRSAAASTAARCAAVHVHTHTTSTASSRPLERGVRLATVMARHLRGALGIVVERRREPRVDQLGVGELLQRDRVHRRRCGRSPTSPILIICSPASRRSSRRASRGRPHACRTGRAPRRPPVRPRPGARFAPALGSSAPSTRPRSSSVACVTVPASSCDSDTPSSRTPRADVELAEQRARDVEHGRAHVGRLGQRAGPGARLEVGEPDLR